MISSKATVACTFSAQATASIIAQRLKTSSQVLPEAAWEPEAVFLQFFEAGESGRDTVVMVADEGLVLYWLLRSLHLSAAEASAGVPLYRIGHASITLVNVRRSKGMEVIAVG